MNSLFAFCLLLIFAAVGFQEANSDEFDDWDTDYAIIDDITDPYGDSMDNSAKTRGTNEFDDWDTDYAIIEDITDPYGDSMEDSVMTKDMKDKLKALKVKKKCDCSGKVCGCCLLLEFEMKTYHKACFNITEMTELKSIELSLVLDSNKLFAKPILEKERCAKVPYTGKIAKVCLDMYNMKVDQMGFHVCSKIYLRLFSKQAVNFDFQCLLLNKRLLTVEKPSEDPNTALLNFNIGKNLTVPHVTLG
uniref:Venom protein family 2 protein 11 n=1 Tax=Lethocerus distinctifemur TaxID=280095 RepID=A0A2K8JL47_9HEMI|nr:venom protein family 2 protein 11 [Lethocerus distinctifemur]